MAMSLSDLIAREIGRFMARFPRSRDMVVTSYDPTTHSVKGTFMPEGVASGWIPIQTTGASASGISVQCGPSIGDQCKVDYSEGDPEAGHVIGFGHNDIDQPPGAPSGTLVIKHNPTGVTVTINGSGVNINAASQPVTIEGQTIALTAAASITLTAPTINTVGETHLGSTGGVPAAQQGTVDTGGNADVSSLATKVFVT